MENFTLNKLWDLRAELDDAITSEDYDRIKEVKVKYRNLVDRAFLYNPAFICYNYAFWTTSDRQSHNSQNVISILKNIEKYEEKYIDKKDVSVKLKTHYKGNFLAEDIWVLRAMYDKFLNQSQSGLDELQTEQNMILGKAIYDRLIHLLNMERHEDYYNSLKTIIKEVREGYESIYGNQQPKIDYSQIAEEYLEK